MLPFLYNFFHNETTDRTEKGLVKIPKDRNDWPESWKKIEYKQYSLFKEILLPQTEGFFFKEILSRRRSSEGYILGNKLTLAKLSSILQCGYGLQGCTKEEKRETARTVPSAGGRYPLEVYVFLFKHLDACVPGIYHYNVKRHTLEPVKFFPFSREDIRSFSPQQEWLQDTNGMICIAGVFHRTIGKYGSRGYRFILLEAGHVAQNMLLAGTENGVNVIPIGGVDEDTIEKMLGFSSAKERIVYTLFL